MVTYVIVFRAAHGRSGASPGLPALPNAAPPTTTLEVTFPDHSTALVAKGYNDDWWLGSFPTWHSDVFTAFAAYLDSGRFDTYWGFGEWIGPTLLFAAQRRHIVRAFANEPDPKCLQALRANVAANPLIAERTFVSSLCISAATASAVMYGAGASGSFVNTVDNAFTRKYVTDHPELSWVTHCLTFPAFVEEHRIRLSSTFIKVDMEGAEWGVLGSLHGFFRAMEAGSKPTMMISLHANDEVRRNSSAVDAFLDTVHLFAYGGRWPDGPGGGQLPVTSPSSALTREVLEGCMQVAGCDIIVSDTTLAR